MLRDSFTLAFPGKTYRVRVRRDDVRGETREGICETVCVASIVIIIDNENNHDEKIRRGQR